uniref:DUF4371 domain-containing protein n=1 Tax=Oreochromis niloticus TaxID=8128 RepID=A0A669FB93_ORENI
MVERKVDSESRAFQHQWVAEYMFTDIAGKPVCLSGANVAVIKEFNLRRHYETKRQDKLKNLNAEQKLQKVEELKKNLTFHQTFFTRAKSHSEAVMKASFIVAEEPNQPGTTLKSCMMKVCDILCPDKTQILANVSLRRNTIADRVCEMATDLRTQLCERSKNFIAYSLAVDESTDMMDIAQLTIFIRGEEILDIKSMHGTTTGKDIFENVCQSVADMKLPWDKLVGLTTDGAPMLSKSLNHRQVQSFMWEIDSEFADIPHHTEVCWLSWGKVLNRVFELSKETCQFMDMYDAVKAFQVKLSQMHQYNLPHFPCCQVMLNQVSALCICFHFFFFWGFWQHFHISNLHNFDRIYFYGDIFSLFGFAYTNIGSGVRLVT